MTATTLSLEDARAANLQLVDDGSKGAQAVHDLVVAYHANRRTGSANTKTRGEIRGTGKKMYRQKGTGNARHGDGKGPLHVGGGVAFGPRPRDYSKAVPRKVRRLALRRVLGDRIAEGAVQLVDAFEIADGKTKSFAGALNGLTAGVRVLVVAREFSEPTYLAARNVQWALLETAASVNVEQLASYHAIILTRDALEVLAARTA